MRKVSILFALGVVLTILLNSVGIVSAQYSCTAIVAVPPVIRGEGLAELVTDLVLNCSGTLQSAGSVNIQIFLNTNVTSKVLDGAGTTEALLMLDDPPPGSQVLNTNIFLGRNISQNSIAWIGIPLSPPGPRVFRFKNLRANAHQIFNPGSPLPGQIMELISVSGTQSIPINNPQQVMAFVQKGMNTSVSDLSGKPSQFLITFSEGFTGAFKKDIQGSYQNLQCAGEGS